MSRVACRKAQSSSPAPAVCFHVPNRLARNEPGWSRMTRDNEMKQVYQHVFDRAVTKRCSSAPGDKNNNPLLAIQCAPGGGKSFFLDELCRFRTEDTSQFLPKLLSDKHLNRFMRKNSQGTPTKPRSDPNTIPSALCSTLLNNVAPVAVTFSSQTPHVPQDDSEPEACLALRLLFRFLSIVVLLFVVYILCTQPLF